MGSSKTAVTDDSATESDGSKTETDIENNNNNNSGSDQTNNESDDDDDDDDDEDEESSRSRRVADPNTFSEGEKVLAYHKSFIYEAKVRKVEYRMKQWKYFVHYLGWNKNWDEWVGVDRLMKYTDENIQKQKALKKKLGADKNAKLGRAFQRPKSSGVGRGKRRKTEAPVKDLLVGKLVSIQIPQILKKQLVDDCEFVTHLGKLVKLPRKPNVDDICKKYLKYRQKKDGMITDSVGEIMKGLRCYFDNALPAMLLYKSERQQYRETIIDLISPSTIYGAEHLLRLFVKLPELLHYANVDEETSKELLKVFIDFLKFLQRNQSAYFLSSYHVPVLEQAP